MTKLQIDKQNGQYFDVQTGNIRFDRQKRKRKQSKLCIAKNHTQRTIPVMYRLNVVNQSATVSPHHTASHTQVIAQYHNNQHQQQQQPHQQSIVLNQLDASNVNSGGSQR